MKRHVVQPNDTLIAVLKHLNMDPKLSKALARYNGIKNEDLIYQGQIIKIPEESVLTGWAKPGETGSGGPGKGTPGIPKLPGGSGGGSSSSGAGGPASGQKKPSTKTGSPPKVQSPPKKTPTPTKHPTQAQKHVEQLNDEQLATKVLQGRMALAFGPASFYAKEIGLSKMSHQDTIDFMRRIEQQAFDRKLYKQYLLYGESRIPVKGTEPTQGGSRLTPAQLRTIQLGGE